MTPGMRGNGIKATRRTRIKLCGITTVDEADSAVALGVDALGMVFTRTESRSVLPHTAMQIAKRIPPLVSVVGVFSNPSDPDLMAWSGRWVQLIGDENEAQIQRVARLRAIIKGFAFDAAQVRRWDRCTFVSAMLVNMPSDAANGAGSSAIDDLAEVSASIHTPVIIGGDFTPESAAACIRSARPLGIDITGEKRSTSYLREIIHAVREADAS